MELCSACFMTSCVISVLNLDILFLPRCAQTWSPTYSICQRGMRILSIRNVPTQQDNTGSDTTGSKGKEV